MWDLDAAQGFGDIPAVIKPFLVMPASIADKCSRTRIDSFLVNKAELIRWGPKSPVSVRRSHTISSLCVFMSRLTPVKPCVVLFHSKGVTR